jgi:hypothetical protein
MFKILIAIISIACLTGCHAFLRDNYVEYNHKIGVQQTAYLGDAIFSAYVGTCNKSGKNRVPEYLTELVYLGKQSNNIFISYYDYVDFYIRPAFSKQLFYDLNDTKTIGFKRVRINVLEATNTYITYTVLGNGALGEFADSVAYKDFIIIESPTTREQKNK